ncbi:MAG: hypothetical protein M3N48_10105 [Verrucomicrobiota bacterium]|nr:hypothetical protein [Verrucomicrobiota bacterium]
MPTRDHPITEGVEELGGGFRRVGRAEFMTGGFESVYHGDYLYFRSRRVSYYASSSLSPSRAFAAYADIDFQSEWRHDQYGFHVYSFRAADQQISRVTSEPLYYQGEFRWEWHEPERFVVLHFNDGRAPKFSLPPTGPNHAMQRTAGRSAF